MICTCRIVCIVLIDYIDYNRNGCFGFRNKNHTDLKAMKNALYHTLHLLYKRLYSNIPDSKVHGAKMGPIWGRQDPGGPHVGPMNLVIWDTVVSFRHKRYVASSGLSCGSQQPWNWNTRICLINIDITSHCPEQRANLIILMQFIGAGSKGQLLRQWLEIDWRLSCCWIQFPLLRGRWPDYSGDWRIFAWDNGGRYNGINGIWGWH